MMEAADPFETSCISIRLKSVITPKCGYFQPNSNFINILVYLFMTNNTEYFSFMEQPVWFLFQNIFTLHYSLHCDGSKLVPSTVPVTVEAQKWDNNRDHRSQIPVARSPWRLNFFKMSPNICSKAIRNVSNHFEHLENRSRGLDVTWQPIRGDLTVHPWTVTLPWG